MSAAENSDADSNKLESVIQVRFTGPSFILHPTTTDVCDVIINMTCVRVCVSGRYCVFITQQFRCGETALAPPGPLALFKRTFITFQLIVLCCHCLHIKLHFKQSLYFSINVTKLCEHCPTETGGECFVWGEEVDGAGPFTWCSPYMSTSTSTRNSHKEPQR